MTQRRFFVVVALLCSLAVASPAAAKEWIVLYDHSHLGFFGVAGDTPFEGRFQSFKVSVDFDPYKPEEGKISAVIDIASATTDDAQRDGMLPTADWFDTAHFPQATFVSSGIRKTGDHDYEADGTLTVKGVSVPTTLPFSLVSIGTTVRAQGRVLLARTDFDIGMGQWVGETTVKHEVDVKFDIFARPGDEAPAATPPAH